MCVWYLHCSVEENTCVDSWRENRAATSTTFCGGLALLRGVPARRADADKW